MAQTAKSKNKESIEIDATDLTTAQLRQLKSLTTLLAHVLSTDTESEYFDGAAESIRVCASLIKQANFVEAVKESKIPYGEQVLEYSLDVLQEHIEGSRVVNYDN
jgi:hypothetical protein